MMKKGKQLMDNGALDPCVNAYWFAQVDWGRITNLSIRTYQLFVKIPLVTTHIPNILM
jgi:hypothetical protein